MLVSSIRHEASGVRHFLDRINRIHKILISPFQFP
jgi:hypothetical protein